MDNPPDPLPCSLRLFFEVSGLDVITPRALWGVSVLRASPRVRASKTWCWTMV